MAMVHAESRHDVRRSCKLVRRVDKHDSENHSSSLVKAPSEPLPIAIPRLEQSWRCKERSDRDNVNVRIFRRICRGV